MTGPGLSSRQERYPCTIESHTLGDSNKNFRRTSGCGSARMDLAWELVDSMEPETRRLITNGIAPAAKGSASDGLQNFGIPPARTARHRSQAMTSPKTPLSPAPSGRDAAR